MGHRGRSNICWWSQMPLTYHRVITCGSVGKWWFTNAARISILADLQHRFWHKNGWTLKFEKWPSEWPPSLLIRSTIASCTMVQQFSTLGMIAVLRFPTKLCYIQGESRLCDSSGDYKVQVSCSSDFDSQFVAYYWLWLYSHWPIGISRVRVWKRVAFDLSFHDRPRLSISNVHCFLWSWSTLFWWNPKICPFH
jgi:hypothetical protein